MMLCTCTNREHYLDSHASLLATCILKHDNTDNQRYLCLSRLLLQSPRPETICHQMKPMKGTTRKTSPSWYFNSCIFKIHNVCIIKCIMFDPFTGNTIGLQTMSSCGWIANLGWLNQIVCIYMYTGRESSLNSKLLANNKNITSPCINTPN